MNHLSQSYLCPDCDFAGSDSVQCAKCTNRSGLLNLASVLNRKTVSREAVEVLRFIPSWKEVA